MLELQNLSFGVEAAQGKKEILKDISLTVGDNKFVVITGPNGSGKSTLLRCATLLETMDAGSLIYCGENAVRMYLSGAFVDNLCK